jgi:nitrilase
MSHRLAVIQHPPVYLDLKRSIEKAVRLIEEAAQNGAKLVIFPEAFLPGYPTWVWRLRPGNDMSLCKEIHARLLANAVDLSAGGADRLFEAAAKHSITVVCGMNEREGEHTRSTLYNTNIIIGDDGSLLNTHRKLIPTNPERMVWGPGDARGLRVVPTAAGRIGVLPCWESLMPLARYAMYADGVEIFVAPTWDCGDGWQASMRHIAREGGCWVVGCAAPVQGRDIPADLPGRAQLFPDDDEWLCSGGSVVVAPFSGPVGEPIVRESTVVYADVDLSRVAEARRSFDVAGHYMRPDVFQLQVRRGPAPPIEFLETDPTKDCD